MTSFREIFRKPNIFLLVIHARNEQQVATAVKVARDNGADGVFLNNHSVNLHELVGIYKYVRKLQPDYFVSLNPTNIGTMSAIELAPFSVSGLLTDNAGIQAEMSPDAHKLALSRHLNFQNEHYDSLYFGGLSLKHQVPAHEVRALAANAVSYMDVATLGGTNAWSTPALGHVQQFRAVASGLPLVVIHDNTDDLSIQGHLPYADGVIVTKGLGIDGRSADLDGKKVRRYADSLIPNFCK